MKKENILSNIMEIILYIVVAVFVAFIIKNFLIYNVEVSGSSMDYTLADGEVGLVSKVSSIDRLDIVIFEPPNDVDNLYVKRVVGLPGDSIEYINDILYVNELEIEEPFLNEKKNEINGYLTPNFSLEELLDIKTIPKGKAFVLGDNRRNSVDSRKFGLVDIEDLDELKLIFWPLSDIKLLP